MDKIDELLTRGVDTIYPSKEELEKVLRSGKKIKLYQGFDPTGTQLHIGHAVAINTLRRFQELGHEVIFLIGDGTGQAGDPSGKTHARHKFFEQKELRENARDYVMQAGKIVNFGGDNPVKVLYNGDWLNEMRLAEILNVAGYFSVQQFLERDMYQERMKLGESVNLREFLYPLLQAYDSVAMKVDLEVGGTDQTFNMLAGRTLVKAMQGRNKFVLTVPLLADSSGRKIGKSEGNVIGITDKPEDLYGKIMSLPDSAIVPCFELITDLPMNKVKTIKGELKKSDVNPMDYKKKLAHQIVEQYNNSTIANSAQRIFEQNYQEGKKDVSAKDVYIKEPLKLHESLFKNLFVSSASVAKQLIRQGGVRINGERIENISFVYEPKDDDIIEIGKHKVFRVKSK